MRKTLLLLPVCLFLGTPLPAQEKKPKQEQKDPQAAYEPLSKPGEGQAFLQRMAGTWDVEKVFYPKSSAPVRQKGESRQTMTHGGRFLQCEFTFHRGEQTTTEPGSSASMSPRDASPVSGWTPAQRACPSGKARTSSTASRSCL